MISDGRREAFDHRFLAQFDQHAVARRGMQKRHAAAVRARHRRLVDQAVAERFQPREMRFDVVDAKADVVDSFAAFLDELRDGDSGRVGSSNSRFASPTERNAVLTPCVSTVST